MSSAIDNQRFTGLVKWYNSTKGYGFITPDGRVPNVVGDVFVHTSEVPRTIAGRMAENTKVSFSIGHHNGKVNATNVQLA